MGPRRMADRTPGTPRLASGWDALKASRNPNLSRCPDCSGWVVRPGLHTALKPSHEPIVVARKPLAGTVAQNVLEHGTGALNVDGCRVGDNAGWAYPNGPGGSEPHHMQRGEQKGDGREPMTASAGRWPANVVLDERAAGLLDEQTGELHSQDPATRHRKTVQEQAGTGNAYALGRRDPGVGNYYGDSGGASRFFLTTGFSTLDEWPLPGDASTEDASTSAGKSTASSDDNSPTDGSGNRSTGQSPPDTTSTTETTTGSTTGSKTSNSSSEDGTSDTTGRSEPPRSSGTGNAGVAAATSGSPSPNTPSAAVGSDRAIASRVRVNTSASGASETAQRGTPTTGSTEPSEARRAFYCAKASRGERNAGLEGFKEQRSSKLGAGLKSSVGTSAEVYGLSEGTTSSEDRSARNYHPTVKPIELMRWLVRLVTPPDGTVLDPFAGSGTTGIACVLEGFDFVGIEREDEYADIAEARIAWWAKHRGDGEAAAVLAAGEAREDLEAQGQTSLFDEDAA